MDTNRALELLQSIDSDACQESMQALAGNVSDEVLTKLYFANKRRYDRNRDLVNRIYGGTVQPPAGYKFFFKEEFDTLDTSLWSVYGPGNNETWGQGQGRTGFYSPNALSVTAEGLRVTTKLDPQGRKASSGKSGFQTGFITTRGGILPVLPKFGHYEIKWRIGVAPGFWPAPLWLRCVPGGASTAEVDTMEWFSQYPDKVRQAIHLKRDGGSTTYNVAASQLGLKQDKSCSNLGDWHTSASRIEPDGVNHVRFTQYLDGVVTYSFSTADLAAVGKPHDDWIANFSGWDIAVCTQTGGAGGDTLPGATGPWNMEVAWITCSVPQ